MRNFYDRLKNLNTNIGQVSYNTPDSNMYSNFVCSIVAASRSKARHLSKIHERKRSTWLLVYKEKLSSGTWKHVHSSKRSIISTPFQRRQKRTLKKSETSLMFFCSSIQIECCYSEVLPKELFVGTMIHSKFFTRILCRQN